MIVSADSSNSAWEQWYRHLEQQAYAGFKQESRAGIVVGEVLNAITVISDPSDNFVRSQLRKSSNKYAIMELLWYLSGSNRLADIQPFAKFWETISDDGFTLNSAYGYRISEKFGFDQWEHIKDLLTKDPLSRQAVIHIKDASNIPTKDTPCTMSLQYSIRDNKLHATTYMRSNDIWLGFPYDVFAFTSLQILLAMTLGVGIGEYTHIAGSLHLYERNLVMLDDTKKS